MTAQRPGFPPRPALLGQPALLDTMTADEVDSLSPMELCALIRTSSDLKYSSVEVSDGETVSFPTNLPARSAFGASGLALGGRVEIECIATTD